MPVTQNKDHTQLSHSTCSMSILGVFFRKLTLFDAGPDYINGLVQERHNSIANPSIYSTGSICYSIYSISYSYGSQNNRNNTDALPQHVNLLQNIIDIHILHTRENISDGLLGYTLTTRGLKGGKRIQTLLISCLIMIWWDKETDDIDGLVQEDVTPLLTHWSYVFHALTHQL